MVHLEINLGQSLNDGARWVSFRFEDAHLNRRSKKGIIAEVKMSNIEHEENGLSCASSWKLYWKSYHEDGSITQTDVLKPVLREMKVGEVVFQRRAARISAGENYRPGLTCRLVDYTDWKDGVDKFKYSVIPTKVAHSFGKYRDSQKRLK